MNNKLGISVGILAAIVGIARGIGGLSLVINHEDTSTILVGVGLLIVAILLMTSGILYAIKCSSIFRNTLTIAIIFFWIDGIINGFILFGMPQLSGQIINIILVIIIMTCIWHKRNN